MRKHNPSSFTARGERMYGHIRDRYGDEPRAQEIAARTVYARARAAPGLVHNPNDQHPDADAWFKRGMDDCSKVFDRADFAVDSAESAITVVENTMARYEQQGLFRDWCRAHEHVSQPELAFASWRLGWMRCATGNVERLRDERVSSNPWRGGRK